MRQRWEDLLFAHWPMPSSALRHLVPDALEIDEFDGTSWVGVVPFRMADVAPRACPAIVGRFPELNLRLYVRHGDRPGVWFLSLDAASRLAVKMARRFFSLPYEHARMRCATRVNGARCEVEYSSERLTSGGRSVKSGAATLPRFAAKYVGLPARVGVEPASLAEFLTERYALYAEDRKQQLWSAEVHHAPWPLQRAQAEISQNELGAPHGLELDGPAPLLYFAKRLDVVVWPLRRMG